MTVGDHRRHRPRAPLPGVTLRDVSCRTPTKRRIEPAPHRATPDAHALDGRQVWASTRSRTTASSRLTSSSSTRSSTQTLSLHPELLFDPRFAPGRHRAALVLRADHGARAGAPVVRRQRRTRAPGATCGSTRATPPGTSAKWEQEKGQIDENGFASFEAFMLTQYAQGKSVPGPNLGRWPLPTQQRPVRASSATTSTAAAQLVLYALQQKIGNTAFPRDRARMGAAQTAVTVPVGTGDFIALASQVAGQDLTRLPRGVGLRRPPCRRCPDIPTGHRMPRRPRRGARRPLAPIPRKEWNCRSGRVPRPSCVIDEDD